MRRRAVGGLAVAAAMLMAAGRPAAVNPESRQTASPARLAVDVFVFDSAGRPVPTLGAADFTVTVDGRPRQVLAAHYVYRGPGAETAARGAGTGQPAARGGPTVSSLAAPAAATAPMAESSRTILIVLDETSFPRGGEKAVANVTSRLLDRFGPGDRLAAVNVPLPASTQSVEFSADRGPIRDALNGLAGRARPVDVLARMNDSQPIQPVGGDTGGAAGGAAGAAGAGAAGSSATGTVTTGAGAAGTTGEEPAKEKDRNKPETQPIDANTSRAPETAEGTRGEDVLDVLAKILAGLRATPGPKSIVVATAGLPDTERSRGALLRRRLQEVEMAAASARAVIHVLGVAGTGSFDTGWNDLETLARATGGDFVRPARNADTGLDRLGLALSGSYLLEVEGDAGDATDEPRALRVTVGRSGAQTRSARRVAWRDDPPFKTVDPVLPPEAAAGSPNATSAPRPSRREAKPDPETDALVARSVEYAYGYLREFRNVVAEEDYLQSTSGREQSLVRTRSDFLIVLSPDGKGWVPFRDVFEVNGAPLRDRDERVRRLFLDKPAGSRPVDSTMVEHEGSRFNLMSTKTTVNVPMTALKYLFDENRRNVRFRRGREETIEGVKTLRIDFEETGRPTVIYDPTSMNDIPATGSLWVEPMTGRIIRTFLRATQPSVTGRDSGLLMESTVKYRRVDALGLWLPAEMKETYRVGGLRSDCVATYSNYRTFQVKTDQEIKKTEPDPKKAEPPIKK